MEIKKLKTADEYVSFINNKGSVNICKFSASWCGPCRVLERTLSELDQALARDANIAEIDVDNEEFSNICDEIGIRGVPVLAYYIDGELVDKTVGLQSASDIYNKIESFYIASA